MTPFTKALLAAVATLALLGACVKEDTYPVTGEQCGPEDPVKELDAADCYVPPAGI
ncbi:hypothetical protein Q5Y75_02405 [Ruegeria sp. 2205SS24-7]|uniref:hypothetical protein n=1 Tax=Ruegeria discodermiae TaxID=3064389 RepID=UPI0027410155|nr:hypothetical protein [Ruegeria sp. 2205SS24-7]MDP5216060.1 hypothetical protein [Ruegeria sp. 2205SS24-7]